MTCNALPQNAQDAGHLEPAAVLRHRARRTASSANIQPIHDFYARRAAGTLPAVSWVVPSRRGQRAPAGARRRRPGLRHRPDQHDHERARTGTRTAIFLAWDDWGGFYDHVAPPTVDENGYGLRVPGS